MEILVDMGPIWIPYLCCRLWHGGGWVATRIYNMIVCHLGLYFRINDLGYYTLATDEIEIEIEITIGLADRVRK